MCIRDSAIPIGKFFIFTNSDGWKVKNFPIGIASLAPLSVLPTAKTNASKAIPTKQ